MRPPRLRGVHRVAVGAAFVALLVVAFPADHGVEAQAIRQEARAFLDVSPFTGTTATVFELDATRSHGSLRPGGETRHPIVDYEWDFEGDGVFEPGERLERRNFPDLGRHAVTVRITDEAGETASATRNVTVAEAHTGLRWNVVTDNLGMFWLGAQVTLFVSVIAIVAGLPLGIVFGLLRVSGFAPIRFVAGAYIEFLRGTPLLVQIFIIIFGLPELGIRFGTLPGAIIALTINTSAYQAEIIRSGIQAIPRGQMEAAVAMGLTYPQAMKEVILPQALRLVIPPLTNEFIILIKDSSLVSTIGVLELMGMARLLAGRTFRFWEPLLAVAMMYFVMTYSLSLLLQRMERKLAIPGLGSHKGGGH